MKDLRVYTAALFGFGAPATNLLLETLEPALKALVLLGQFGVAVVTILYIFSKWKQIKAATPPKRKRRTRK